MGVTAVGSTSREGVEGGRFSMVNPSDAAMNALGAQGWELVTSYLEMETAWTNFGSSRYVTGLQPNVRPQRVVLLFRRALHGAPAPTPPTPAPPAARPR